MFDKEKCCYFHLDLHVSTPEFLSGHHLLSRLLDDNIEVLHISPLTRLHMLGRCECQKCVECGVWEIQAVKKPMKVHDQLVIVTDLHV